MSSRLSCALFILVKVLCIDRVLLVSLNANYIKYRFFSMSYDFSQIMLETWLCIPFVNSENYKFLKTF